MYSCDFDTQFTCLLSVIVFHMVRITCLLSAFRKDRYETNQNSVFEYEFIHCIRVIIVLGLLLYLRFCHGLTKGEIVRFMCFGVVKPCQIMFLLSFDVS